MLLVLLGWNGLDLSAESTIGQLSWIPENARLLMVLNRPLDNQDLYAKLGAAIVSAGGIDETFKQFSEITGMDLFRDAERLVIARVSGKGEGEETVAIALARAAKMTPAPSARGNLRLERLDERNLVFGDTAAVERVVVLYKGSGNQSVLQNAETVRLIRGFGPSAQIWGIASPELLKLQSKESELAAADIEGHSVCRSLSATRVIAFSAEALKDSVLIVMKTEVKDAGDVAILADALRAEVAPLRRTAKNTAPREPQQVRNQALVRTTNNSVELELLLNGPTLELICTHSGLKTLLQWKLSDAGRERFQNVREIMDLLDLSRGSRVADVGSEMGFFTVRLARAVGLQGKVYAVDIEPDVLEQLRWRVQDGSFPQVEVVLGQPEDPKLPREQLDAVLIVNSYHEMPHHRQMLEHIRMALKPGGRLLITEPMSIERRNESREVQEKHHVIAPELVEQDLRQEGFEIIVLNDDFIQYPESGRRDWLILARGRDRRPD
jgi:SAM-dependent methyltransferase